ncbi:MAG: alpha/beta fold hydrolase [Myxococcota bacterium]
MSGRARRGWHPRSRWTAVDGALAHYVRTGPPGDDAPALVLVHGFLVSSFSWRFNLEPLSRDFDVIAPCQKGFGWSERPHGGYDLESLGRFVLGVLDRLEVERAHLCGNSLGGAIALWIARNAPERVHRLVLVNSLAVASSLPRVPTLLKAPWMAPFYRPFVRPTLARLGLQTLAYRRLRVDSRYMEGFRPPFESRHAVPTALAVARKLEAMVEEVEGFLPEIPHHTLVAWGTKDLLLSARAAPEIVRRMPDARLVTFPHAGHCPHEEEPERFNRMVRAFLLEEA